MINYSFYASNSLTLVSSYMQIISWILNCQDCCSRATSDGNCCLLRHFTLSDGNYEVGGAVNLIKSCRTLINKFVQVEEKNTFINEQFRNCIDGTEKGKDKQGLPVFKMKYIIKPSGKATDSFEVCRKVFAYCWQLSENKLKQIAAALKVSEFGYVPSYLHRRFRENTRHGKLF